MAFINEKLSVQDIEIINSYKLTNPVTNDLLNPRRWTIDRDRNVYLIGIDTKTPF